MPCASRRPIRRASSVSATRSDDWPRDTAPIWSRSSPATSMCWQPGLPAASAAISTRSQLDKPATADHIHQTGNPMSNSRKPASGLADRRIHDLPAPAGARTSRRAFLKSGAGLVAGGAAAQVLPEPARAQPATTAERNPEVRRLQRQRRILLKGGIVLTLDRQVGDFAR